MRSALATVANRRAGRNRSASNLSAIPPSSDAEEYLPELAAAAATIVYRSPLPSPQGHPIYIINAAAFPDTYDIDYDSLLPYVLARLPGEDDLITGTEYEIIFFAGGQPEGATGERKQGPGMGWYLQAYHVLSRAMRKRLQRLYIVHPRTWVRVLISVFSTIVSPKFRRKIIHIGSLSALQQHLPIEDLLVPLTAFLHDRKLDAELDEREPGRAFGAANPLPRDLNSGQARLPRVLRETTSFLSLPSTVKSEGLFRIPPHSQLASILHDAYDRGQKFIVWKDAGDVFAQPDLDQTLLSEASVQESYGVHLAAALIKTWYRELRQPIIPDTAYDYMSEHFGGQAIIISLDDLVALLDPKSSLSVLTNSSREILTTHLLPLLSMIASHERQNKMSIQNLSICFSITLLHGTNQMDDMKMSVIVQKVLKAAIELWPQLRERLGLDEYALLDALRPPKSSSDYEDPLATHTHVPSPTGQNQHHIIMSDDNLKEDISNDLMSHMQQIPRMLQKLPGKVPQLVSKTTPPAESAKPPPPAVPRRKPARSISTPKETQPVSTEPPRYSSISGSVELTEHGSHDNLGPGHEAAPPYQALPSATVSAVNQPPLIMPKRKALFVGEKDGAASDDKSTAQEAAPTPAADESVVTRSSSVGTQNSSAADDAIFRKPSWPASATRRPSDAITSLAKPVLPGAQRPSPMLTTSNLAMPGLPKPRTPSPGLLLRMNSFDAFGSSGDKHGSPDTEKNYRLTPGKLALKKASVDDLRRLYEDRLDTVNGLAQADLMKRSNSQS